MKTISVLLLWIGIPLMVVGQDMRDTTWAKYLMEEADSLEDERELKKALLKLDTVGKIHQNVFGDNSLELSNVLIRAGRYLMHLNEFDTAIIVLRKVISIRKSSMNLRDSKINRALFYVGLCYDFKGDYDLSIKTYLEAIDVSLKEEGSDSPIIASYYYSLGNAYLGKGVYRLAIKSFEKSLELKKKIYGSDHGKLAAPYNALGDCYCDNGKYEKGIDFNKKAINILLKSDPSENSESFAYVYSSLGKCLLDKGDYDKAIEFNEKALRIYRNATMEKGRRISVFLNNLGTSYFKKGEYVKALGLYQEALEAMKKSYGPRHNYVAIPNNKIGMCYFQLGDYDQAITFHQTAEKIQLDTLGSKHPDIVTTYNLLGDCYFKKQEYETSIEYFDKALSANNFTQNALGKVLSIPLLIKTFEKRGKSKRYLFQLNSSLSHLKSSFSDYQYCREAVRYQRNKLQTERTKLGSEIRSSFEGNILTNLFLNDQMNEIKYLYDAFSCAEESWGLYLFESIRESEALHFSGIPDTLIQKEKDLRLEISYYEKKLFKAEFEDKKPLTDTAIQKLNNTLFSLNRQYEALKKDFEKDFPQYHELKYDITTIKVEEVMKELLLPGESLLEYFVGENSIFLFVIQEDGYQVIKINKDFPLEQLINDFREGVYGHYSTTLEKSLAIEKATTQYIDAAQYLYQKLIAPVDTLLTETLIIIPDGILSYIPFEILLTNPVKDPANFGAYPYLIKQHQISYCYSATLLRQMRQKKHKKKPTGSLLAFAPFYEGSYSYLQDVFGNALAHEMEPESGTFDQATNRRDFSKLPNSGEEVYTASKLWNGRHFLNKDATEERFNQLANSYNILHLSTHSAADSRTGDYSYLAFAEIPDTIENELLFVRDLYNLQINADLVVLSACETGLGELQRGEGIISLARAFAYAGAKSIVTSLWVVNDSSTKDLMLAFYKQLRKDHSKDAALRQSKLNYLQKNPGEKSHPFFWAGFIAVGDMSTIK